MTAPTVEIITPSYVNDADCLVLLAESRRLFAPDLSHSVIVPPQDVSIFERKCNGRAHVRSLTDVLPRGLIGTHVLRDAVPARFPRLRSIQAINSRFPLVPVRGWILQQVTKIAAVAASTSDLVLVLDSDTVMISTLPDIEELDRVYRLPGGINNAMDRHRKWQKVSAEILGLPQVASDDDFISPVLFWRPDDVRGMISRIESHHSRPWWDVVCRHVHFSEATLFGRYAVSDLFEREVSWTADDRCATYWSTDTVTSASVAEVVSAVSPSDLFMQIQSTSDTSADVRTTAFELAVLNRGGQLP